MGEAKVNLTRLYLYGMLYDSSFWAKLPVNIVSPGFEKLSMKAFGFAIKVFGIVEL
ncbi:hypothetical protein D3C87_2212200 [compost metagenome]